MRSTAPRRTPPLQTASGSRLPSLERNVDHFLNRTTMLVGGSGMGKTTAVQDMLFQLNSHVAAVFAIAPSNGTNGAYNGYLPPHAIRTDMDLDWLTAFWGRQQAITEVWVTANDITNQERLVRMVGFEKEKRAVKSYHQETMRLIKRAVVEEVNNVTRGERIDRIKKKRNERLQVLYRKIISREQKLLLQRLDSSESDTPEHRAERQVLYTAALHVNTNPNVVLIIDDCTEKFGQWRQMCVIKGDTNNIFEQLFYRGRHVNITLIITAHSDTCLKATLRKNLRLIMFMDAKATGAAFSSGRKADGYSKHEKNAVQHFLEPVFGEGALADAAKGATEAKKRGKKFEDHNPLLAPAPPRGHRRSFRKLCYLVGEQRPFFFFQAVKHRPVPVGDKNFWGLDRLFPKRHSLKFNPLAQSRTRRQQH